MKPVFELPIIKACCKTCPFKIVNEKQLDSNLAALVTERTLFKSQQVCHGTEGKNREAKNRCKGSYDNNFEIYRRLKSSHLLK